jgi:hypothetical protein
VDSIMLCEISETWKDKYHVFSLMWNVGLQNNQTHKNTHTWHECKRGTIGGELEGGEKKGDNRRLREGEYDTVYMYENVTTKASLLCNTKKESIQLSSQISQ